MNYLIVAILCAATARSCLCVDSDNAPKHGITSEDVKQLLGVDHDYVTNYDIVKIDFSDRLHKRDVRVDENIMRIKVFGKNISISLNPTDDILAGEDTPIYYATSARDGTNKVVYDRKYGLMEKVGRIWENQSKQASFVIRKNRSEKTIINGHIKSEGLSVRSLQPDVAKRVARSLRFRDSNDDDTSDSTYHVVFETNSTSTNNNYYHPESVKNKSSRQSRETQINSALPDVLYPEILVVVEYSLWKLFNEDVYGLLEYLLGFWNGVDLRYRTLESLKFRFNIAGIIIGMDRNATPYISKNSMPNDTFRAWKALHDANKYYYNLNEIPLDSYDIFFIMTNRGYHNLQALGLATDIGSACARDHEHNSTWGGAMIYDNAGFYGIHTASHELAHLFGAKHDVDAYGCSQLGGFQMTPLQISTENSADFSNCTINSFRDRFKKNELDCLINRPKGMGKMLSRLLPGRVKNLNQQCRLLGFKETCKFRNTNPCLDLHCLDSNGECTATGHNAADGSFCQGHKKICLHMQCVSLKSGRPRRRNKPTVRPRVILAQ